MSRGIQSMNEGTTNAPPPPEDGWLGTFFADQLEMVELYPTGTDESRTSCGRFTPGSGCMCMNGQPTPPTVVVWMR